MYRTYLVILSNKSVSVYEMDFKSQKTNCVFSCLICECLWQCFFPPTGKACLCVDNALCPQRVGSLRSPSGSYLLN